MSSDPIATKSEERSAPDDGALFSLVYCELRELAARLMRGERRGHTLQPTALVHETWLKLEAREDLAGLDRGRFQALAATAMRRVLVDASRRRRAEKRGGDPIRLEWDDPADPGALAPDLLALEEALSRLAARDPMLERIVELRFFGGLRHPEIARDLGVSLRAVERGWALARALLHKDLGAEPR